MKDNKVNFSKIFWSVFFICLFFIFLIKIFSNGFFLGYRTSFVLSESMVPEIPVASLLIEEKYESDDSLAPGDIITFLVKKSDKHIRITHRIVQIREGLITTKGDANPDADPWIISSQAVEGKIVLVFPHFLQMVCFISVIIIIIIFCVKSRKSNTRDIFTKT